MKLKAQHAPYIANKIGLDLVNASFININTSLESLSKVALDCLMENIQREKVIDEKVRDLLEKHSNEIEDYRMDERAMFRMFKRQIASEENFTITWDDRCSDLSHEILSRICKTGFIDFKVSEVVVKNIIHKAINEYSRIYEQSEEAVIERLKKHKRKLVYGSDEYEIVFNKLYEEELRKKGLS
ncbi:MAG: DUF507 family protein [Helicobacter sp.]|uniref:DUF507 family protein n=1 Tax=Helicobacter sp. 10-6591 TaxID=2004998 RepID=UPI000DCF47AE|nr:DUF507 family protein [Helicobacter sp. 10-6591]MCI6217318.1 DUF507 family protein [Helicobacter sp.]MCI7485569.1 DUF507 family protein [Helicobacter sp.]MDD7567425.1 DUF507 family protein [Helicobacter sp.]MDY5740342.1 DUF507 family protein [Helicobacter sp.]RAX55563.1 competence protein [Helicobacter sp. 10-6591]